MEERKKLMKVLKNKIIYTGNGKIDNGYVRFNQRISEVDEMRNFVPQEDDEIIETDATYVIPGFVDVHSHGGYGKDSMDASADEIDWMVRQMAAKEGITTYFCTTMTQTYDNIEKAIAFLGEHGLMTGGTGAKVRPVVSCKGTTCQYGLIDTFSLSKKIHEHFYVGYHDVVLPHKFKIAVGGCPNNCVKPNLNDMGIIGQRIPKPDAEKCRGCKKCQIEKSCPVHVPKLVDGKLYIDPEECIHCGRCKGKCPFGAVPEYQNGYKIYIGGRWGKRISHGQALTRIFTEEEEVMAVIEKAILLFKDEGIAGERFADTVKRLGFEYVNEKLIG